MEKPKKASKAEEASGSSASGATKVSGKRSAKNVDDEFMREYEIGDDVLVIYHGRWHAAKVRKKEWIAHPEQKGVKVNSYLIHYHGWAQRHDEWVYSDSMMIENDENMKKTAAANAEHDAQLLAEGKKAPKERKQKMGSKVIKLTPATADNKESQEKSIEEPAYVENVAVTSAKPPEKKRGRRPREPSATPSVAATAPADGSSTKDNGVDREPAALVAPPVAAAEKTVEKVAEKKETKKDSDNKQPEKPVVRNPMTQPAKPETPAAVPKTAPAKSVPKKDETSSEEDSEDEQPKKPTTSPAKPVSPVVATRAVPGKPAAKKDESTSEEYSDDEKKPAAPTAEKMSVAVTPTAKPPQAKPPQAKPQHTKQGAESSSDEDSSEDEKPKKAAAASAAKPVAANIAAKPILASPAKPVAKNIAAKPAAVTKPKPEATSEEESCEDDKAKKPSKPAAKTRSAVAQKPPAKPTKESSSDDESLEDEEPKKGPAVAAPAKCTAANEPPKPANPNQPAKSTPFAAAEKRPAKESSSDDDSSEDEKPKQMAVVAADGKLKAVPAKHVVTAATLKSAPTRPVGKNAETFSDEDSDGRKPVRPVPLHPKRLTRPTARKIIVVPQRDCLAPSGSGTRESSEESIPLSSVKLARLQKITLSSSDSSSMSPPKTKRKRKPNGAALNVLNWVTSMFEKKENATTCNKAVRKFFDKYSKDKGWAVSEKKSAETRLGNAFKSAFEIGRKAKNIVNRGTGTAMLRRGVTLSETGETEFHRLFPSRGLNKILPIVRPYRKTALKVEVKEEDAASESQKNTDAGENDAADEIPPKKRGKAAKATTSKKNGKDDGKRDADVSDDDGGESPPKHAKGGKTGTSKSDDGQTAALVFKDAEDTTEDAAPKKRGRGAKTETVSESAATTKNNDAKKRGGKTEKKAAASDNEEDASESTGPKKPNAQVDAVANEENMDEAADQPVAAKNCGGRPKKAASKNADDPDSGKQEVNQDGDAAPEGTAIKTHARAAKTVAMTHSAQGKKEKARLVNDNNKDASAV